MAQVTEDILLSRIDQSGFRPKCVNMIDKPLLPIEVGIMSLSCSNYLRNLLFHIILTLRKTVRIVLLILNQISEIQKTKPRECFKVALGFVEEQRINKSTFVVRSASQIKL